MSRVPVAITIAGVDSGGGAGIAADLKAFAAMGVHGAVAVTSVTAQNTLGVHAVHDLPAEMVVKQILVVAEDLGIDAGKTGMLSNKEIIEAVSGAVARLGFPLVVDPVMVAKSGDPLLREDAVEALKEKLLPVATLVTPNKFEAERLSGITIRSLSDARKAAQIISREYSPEAVIVKGGHISGEESVDLLYWRGSFREFRAPRVEGCTHGTGCAFSAAIAAGLAKGMRLDEAIAEAKKLITMAIDYGVRVGKGHCPVNPSAYIHLPAYRYQALRDVEGAVKLLLEAEDLVLQYYPEVGIQVASALPPLYARDESDVAAVPGRVVRAGDRLIPVNPPAMGASSHLARYILAARRLGGSVGGAVNVRYVPGLEEAARQAGLTVSHYDRRSEPPEIKSREGATIPWGVEEAVRRVGRVPDAIYHEGDWGKEPMIVFLGRDARDAVTKLLRALAQHSLQRPRRED